MPPPPAAVPVERLVAIEFVRPFTLRPVSAVCESVSSRPAVARRDVWARFGEAGLFARRDVWARFGEAGLFARRDVWARFGEAGLFARRVVWARFGAARRAFLAPRPPDPVVARPVLRRALTVRFGRAPLLVAARPPAPPRFFVGVRF
jgi:hypothetical protein